MKNKGYLKNIGNILGIVSLSIALVIFFLILNHLFKTTSYQKLQLIPLVVMFFIIPIGFSLSFLSKCSLTLFGGVVWKNQKHIIFYFGLLDLS